MQKKMMIMLPVIFAFSKTHVRLTLSAPNACVINQIHREIASGQIQDSK
jgi:hypothetical protein